METAATRFKRWPLRLIWIACSLAASNAAAVQLGITTVRNLSFGSFAAGTGGAVTVPLAGTRTKAGGVSLLTADPGISAQFSVVGPTNQSYTITLPPNALISCSTPVSCGSASMTITGFTSSPPATSSSTGQLANGAQTLFVGGTLSVGNSQLPGSYAGSFSVMVNMP